MKNINRQIFFLFFIIIFSFLFNFSALYGYKFEFTTVSDVVKNIKEKFEDFDTYQADFKIISDKAGAKNRQSGKVSYKKKNKMIVDFREPYGQKIVSDGKTMWLYIPSMNVVAEQDLKDETGSLFTTGSASGLKRLFSKYHYKFASKNQPEVQSDGRKAYTLSLKQKESRSGYRTLKVWVSESYLITKITGETTSGKNVEIIFENIKTDGDLANGLFKFDVPSKAKIIKNPFVSEE
jgi:chaperone LolA